jgi:hypothetical protein
MSIRGLDDLSIGIVVLTIAHIRGVITTLPSKYKSVFGIGLCVRRRCSLPEVSVIQ